MIKKPISIKDYSTITERCRLFYEIEMRHYIFFQRRSYITNYKLIYILLNINFFFHVKVKLKHNFISKNYSTKNIA